MGLDEGMRHGAVDRHAEARRGRHRRRAGEAGEIGGPRRQQPGLGAVRPAQPEIDQRLPGAASTMRAAFEAISGLEVQEVDQPGLQQLRLGQRRGDPEIGSSAKTRCPPAGRATSPVKRRVASVVDEVAREAAAPPASRSSASRKRAFSRNSDRLLQPRRHQETAPAGQLAHEELEHRGLRHAVLQIGLQHGELVEVGEQQAAAGVADDGGVVVGVMAMTIAAPATGPLRQIKSKEGPASFPLAEKRALTLR